MNLTFRQIDAFKTVIAAGTVTGAAAMLGISQPAVSRLLSDLETQLGFRLFHKVGRNLQPTAEARLLVEEVRRALSGLERIKTTAEAIGRFGHARLSLVTSPAFAATIVPEMITRFARLRPEAAITLEVQPSDDTVEWMASEHFDFGVTASLSSNPAIESHPLTTAGALCILPDHHPLSARDRLTPADLAEASFVSYRADAQFRFEIDRIFETAGISRRMQYEARTTDALCRLVAAGLGVAIIGTVEREGRVIEGCRAVPFEPEISFSVILIRSRQRRMSAIAEEFGEMVGAMFSLN